MQTEPGASNQRERAKIVDTAFLTTLRRSGYNTTKLHPQYMVERRPKLHPTILGTAPTWTTECAVGQTLDEENKANLSGTEPEVRHPLVQEKSRRTGRSAVPRPSLTGGAEIATAL